MSIVVEETRGPTQDARIHVHTEYPDDLFDDNGQPTRILVTVSCEHGSGVYTHERVCRNMCHLDALRSQTCRAVSPSVEYLERKAVMRMTRNRMLAGMWLCRCHEGYWMLFGVDHWQNRDVAAQLYARITPDQQDSPVSPRMARRLKQVYREVGTVDGKPIMEPLRWEPHEIK